MLDKFTEGDRRTQVHALACKSRPCKMWCRCWCHGITKHLDGSVREDAPTPNDKEKREV